MPDTLSPTPYEARIAIALRLAGGLPIGDVGPAEAAALWKAGLLDEHDVGRLAMRWMDRGLDQGSPELAAIALNPPASLADAKRPFEAALNEMGVTIPHEKHGELTALALYLQAMIEGRLSPMVAMNAIYALYRDEPKARVRHPNRAADDTTHYLGDELGLEYLLAHYLELLELTDEPGSAPRAAELENKLLEEAEILHRHLSASLPGGSDSSSA